MKVVVLMFAAAKELVGHDRVELTLASKATVGDLRREIEVQYPKLRDVLGRSAIAVDHQYAADGVVLNAQSEIGLIPPVSGG